MPSQRSPGFRGGIQRGTTATSAESASLEKSLRRASARAEGDFPELIRRSRLDGRTVAALLGVAYSRIAGAQPDGGIWFAHGDHRPLVAAEAKKQGKKGNAIERWFKNALLFDVLGTEVFLTVCTGDGFFDGGGAQRSLEFAVAADRGDQHRLDEGDVWNQPVGRLWLYRYRTAADADAELDDVVRLAIRTALCRRGGTPDVGDGGLVGTPAGPMHELPGPT